MRVAIQKASTDLTHPTDRRRILSFKNMFANENIFLIGYDCIKKINMDKYDFIIISHFGDIPFLLKQKCLSTKVYIDYCDFIHSVSGFKFYIKSILSFLRGNYSNTLTKNQFLLFLSSCRGVIVGSSYQKKCLNNINEIFVIPDDFKEIQSISNTNEREGAIWEGFSHGNYSLLKKVFYLSNLSKISKLKIITDEKYSILSNFIFKIKTKNILNFLSFFYKYYNYTFSPWTKENLIKHSKNYKFGLIPIGNKTIDKFKPENKIVLYIKLGLFPIVSSIPSYLDFEKKYDLKICFQNDDEFKILIKNVNKNFRKLKVKKDIILSNYSTLSLYNKWIKIFRK